MFAGTFAIANTAIASFLPTYLTIERGMDATVATTISSLNSLFGIAGSLLGGVLCAQMWRRKPILIGAIVLYIFGWLRHPICFVLGADRGAGACGGRTVFYSDCRAEHDYD